MPSSSITRRRSISPSDAHRRTSIALVAIGAAFLLAQLSIVGLATPASFDEAIYISRVSDAAPPLEFNAQRARGITWLIAPATLLGATGAPLRLYLAVLSAVGLVAAFGVWRRLIGGAAALGAGIFAASWLTLFYGSAAMPNLPAALLGVAAAGFALRAIAGSVRDAVFAGLTIAAMGFVRPPDATMLGAAVGLTILFPATMARARTAAALAAGMALGWAPWVVEWWLRAGSPLGGLRRAGRLQGASVGFNAPEHLALTNGPLQGPDPTGAIPIGGALWWAGLAIACTAGIVLVRGTGRRVALVATAGGLGVAVPYLLLTGPSAPRFLLPAYALLSIGAATGAAGVWHLARRTRLREGAIAVAIASGVAWVTVNGVGASIAQDAEERKRAVAVAVGEALASRVRAPCAFAASANYPIVALRSGCMGMRTGDAALRRLDQLRMRGWPVYAVVPEGDDPGAFIDWRASPLVAGWLVLEPRS